MVQVAAGRHVAAALAAAALFLGPEKVKAQDAEPFEELNQPLDPSAPLDPLPDLGVEWPDLEEEADQQIATAPDTNIAEAAGERSYRVYFQGLEGIEAAGITEQFLQLSTLEANKGDPANAAQIDRRAREDADLLAELLRAYGYYDAAVTTRVEAASAGPVQVVLEAEPGPIYRFAEVRLPGIEAAGENEAALRDAFGVEANAPVNAAAVTAGEAALRAELGRRGYVFADVGALDIAVDHETRTATLELPVRPQGARRFGRVVVEGQRLFSASHIETIARFDQGEPYRTERIDDLRRALVATGLVSSVDIRPVARAGTDIVDLAVALEPAPLRTIAGELGYGTGEGFRLEGSWQHRNLLPPEGAVTLRAVAGTREQLIAANLRRNNFGRRDRVLTATVSAGHIERDAYEANTFQLSAGIERQSNLIWQKKWSWGFGAELIASDETDVDVASGTTRDRTFLIGALPAFLSYDGSNDLLDPTEGFRLSGRFSPEATLQGGFFGYGKAQVDGSAYHPVTDNVVMAGRVRLGSIVGENRDRIAPSRRFYAGGGGSVRGYGFQRLGPRDPIFDDPIGGRSLAEFSIEARVRTSLFDGALGIVPFLDAGNIYTSSLPDIGDLRFGVGVGVRYHTRFGPIRVDVGTPLNRRSGDPRVAVYVSLGQAF
ncbi:MAG TPA: BamA/TamA family outer membrane protein [Allosphingosinicella sp.]|uniref:autotransporter assembly complex protein TamA n=1 Tax=Allosphingosinicella sp. TaxID=2823234 RepID=UPI002ED97C62